MPPCPTIVPTATLVVSPYLLPNELWLSPARFHATLGSRLAVHDGVFTGFRHEVVHWHRLLSDSMHSRSRQTA